MIAALVLAVIAAVQGLFLLLLVGFLLVRRAYDRRQLAAFIAARSGIAAPLRAWLVAGAHPDPVVRAMRQLPHGTAIGYASLLARQTIPAAQRIELATALRGEAWIAEAVAQRHSRFWWRRLEAARALSLVGSPRDREPVARLIRDPHPAVQIAAAAALPRVADTALTGEVLDQLHRFPAVVQHFVLTMLRETAASVIPALGDRLTLAAAPTVLATWITLAASLDDPQVLKQVLARREHADAEVRRAVARALRRFPGYDAEAQLIRYLGDLNADVRAEAARSLGELGLPEAVPALAPLLRDGSWLVRLRAGLALAQLGERGRAALRLERTGPDRYARDMATMVSGLTDGAILDMVQG